MFLFFSAESKCYNGMKGKVSGEAMLYAPGVGLNFSVTAGATKFDAPGTDPFLFQGVATIAAFGIAPPGARIGGSFSDLALGSAVSQGLTEIKGIDFSLVFGVGYSSVRSHSRAPCGCEN